MTNTEIIKKIKAEIEKDYPVHYIDKCAFYISISAVEDEFSLAVVAYLDDEYIVGVEVMSEPANEEYAASTEMMKKFKAVSEYFKNHFNDVEIVKEIVVV